MSKIKLPKEIIKGIAKARIKVAGELLEAGALVEVGGNTFKIIDDYINILEKDLLDTRNEADRLRNNCPLSEMPHHHYYYCKKCDEDTIL